MSELKDSPQFNPEKEPNHSITPAVEHASDKLMPSKMKEVLGEAKDYLKRNSLKIKEYFGQLSQEDFDQLLTFDFQEQIKDNMPIKGVFSPQEELTKIKSLPREQKREALSTFKENLARQREALATMRVFIERSIEFNHDVPREKLMGLIEKFGTQYGFDNRQRQGSEQIIDGYYKNRQKVLEIRQQFTDDYELVNQLTGVTLKGEKLDVQVGPMTIDIGVEGFNAGRIYEGSNEPVINFEDSGFTSQSSGKNPINYIVINQDKWIRKACSDLSTKRVRNHEYEHNKNKLFRDVFMYKHNRPISLCDYIDERDQEIKKAILEDYFDRDRKVALEKVKDEITSSLLDRTLPQLQYQLEDFFFKQNGSYDYLACLRNWEIFKDDPFYQETEQRMLVQEYKKTIQRAVDSYAELVNRGKYSNQVAVALLTDKPLDDWPKTIRRLLEQKK